MEWIACVAFAYLLLLPLLFKAYRWWEGRDARKYGAPPEPGHVYGRPRSSKWPEIRDQCIERDGGCCQVCGERRRRYLRGHHKKPFHLYPELELDPNNVITLCEGPVFNCHLFFGHLGNFKERFNPDIEEDARWWRAKLKKAVCSRGS